MAWKKNILETIGNTPLIELHKVTSGLPCTVLAKVEYFNPGNSIKDRMAVKMVEVAEQKGWLKPGGTIIEGTSGNTGMGLALAAISRGYKCIFTTTDKQSKEKVDILKAVGAEVIVCPTNVEPEDPRSYYSVSKRLAEEIPNSWYVNQYDNLANRLAHYETTGPEIWEQTEGKITHLVVATGTGGTVTGTGQYLKEKNPGIKVWAIDAFGSLLTKYFNTGEIDMKEVHPYVTEGIGEDFVPANYDMQWIDHFEQVTDKNAAVMVRRIAKEEGIFAGNSAGAAIQGLMQMKSQLGPKDLVVVIFHDHGSRYVAKMYNDQWMMERGFLEPANFRQLVAARKEQKLIVAEPGKTVGDVVALMNKYDIENIPVMANGENLGSVSQAGLFSRLFTDPDLKNSLVEEIMEKPYPEISFDSTVEKISKLMNKQTGAVLAKDETGNYQIVTKQDILKNLAH